MKKRIMAAVWLSCMLMLSACRGETDGTSEADTESGSSETDSAETAETEADPDKGSEILKIEYNKKDYYTDYTRKAFRKIDLSEGDVTIRAGGTYELTGTLADGRVFVDVPETEDVRLVLNGVDISCENGAPVYAKSCDKLIISLAPGTGNFITDHRTGTDDDGKEIDGCITCRGNLTFNGSGKLTVRANAKDGIVCKDRLIFMEGNFDIEACQDAVVGKEELIVRDGSFILKAGQDGMKASEKQKEELGNILLAGGVCEIRSDADGIQAEGSLKAAGGIYHIIAGEGSAAVLRKMEESGFSIGEWDPDAQAGDETVSRKGMKAGKDIEIMDGIFTVDAADDACHAGRRMTINGGEIAAATGDDAVSAEKELQISGGKLTVENSWEGLEAGSILMSGGEVSLKAEDDGINTNGEGGNKELGPYVPDESAGFVLSGGRLSIETSGDGIDSNGSLTISGGELKIGGVFSDGDESIDCIGLFKLSGGEMTVVTSGQAPVLPDESSLAWIIADGLNGQAGDSIDITDADGNILFERKAENAFDSVMAASPVLKSGESYTIRVNGEVAAAAVGETEVH